MHFSLHVCFTPYTMLIALFTRGTHYNMVLKYALFLTGLFTQYTLLTALITQKTHFALNYTHFLTYFFTQYKLLTALFTHKNNITCFSTMHCL